MGATPSNSVAAAAVTTSSPNTDATTPAIRKNLTHASATPATILNPTTNVTKISMPAMTTTSIDEAATKTTTIPAANTPISTAIKSNDKNVSSTISTITVPATTTTTTTPTVTTSVLPNQNNSSTPAPLSGDAKSKSDSAANSQTSNDDKEKLTVSSAYSQWYKWSKHEQKKREKNKILWYLKVPTTSNDSSSTSTTVPTTTTAKIGSDPDVTTDASNITVAPTYQLRSTAVYSPPHGDRFLPGRNELINTDTSNFKYYNPDDRPKDISGQHTKATMYKTNIRQRHVLFPIPAAPEAVKSSDNVNTISIDDTSLPNVVSRGLQTDLNSQLFNSISAPIPYYERQQALMAPISVFPDYNSNKDGFHRLAEQNQMNPSARPPNNFQEATPLHTNIQLNPSHQLSSVDYSPPSVQQSVPDRYIYQPNPSLQQVQPYSATIQQSSPVQYNAQQNPSVQETSSYYTAPSTQQIRPTQYNAELSPSLQQIRPYSTTAQQLSLPVQHYDQQYPSVQQVRPSYSPSSSRPSRPSILKKKSTVLSQDTYNPLSARTHDQMPEELRKGNSNNNYGIYGVTNDRLLKKSEREKYTPKVSFNLPTSKASQSISRSEKLLFSS